MALGEGIVYNNLWNHFWHAPFWENNPETPGGGNDTNYRLQLGTCILTDGGTIWDSFNNDKGTLRDIPTMDSLFSGGFAIECSATNYARQELFPQNLHKNTTLDFGGYEFSDSPLAGQGTGNILYGQNVAAGQRLQGVVIYCSWPLVYTQKTPSSNMTSSAQDINHYPIYQYQFQFPKDTGGGDVTVQFGNINGLNASFGQIWRAAQKGVL